MISTQYLRSFRLGEYAIFDLAASFLGIWLLSPLLSRLFRLIHLDIPLRSWLLLTLPLAILIHVLVGRYTPMTKYFLDPSAHYLLKIILFALFVLALRGIKIIK